MTDRKPTDLLLAELAAVEEQLAPLLATRQQILDAIKANTKIDSLLTDIDRLCTDVERHLDEPGPLPQRQRWALECNIKLRRAGTDLQAESEGVPEAELWATRLSATYRRLIVEVFGLEPEAVPPIMGAER